MMHSGKSDTATKSLSSKGNNMTPPTGSVQEIYQLQPAPPLAPAVEPAAEVGDYPPLYLVPPLPEDDVTLTPQPPEEIFEEEYARSMSSIRNLGRQIVQREVVLQAGSEETGVEQVASDNTKSAIREMLRTESTFRGRLDIADPRSHPIIDGKVCSADGVPMVEVASNGLIKLEEQVKIQPELANEVIRAQGDVLIAERVDQLQPGQTLFALGMEPKDELQKHKAVYAALGYREGLSYIQCYSKVDEETLEAWSISVDFSDVGAWRKAFAELGVEIPEGESPNTWIQNTFEREMTSEQAKEFALKMRADYYKSIGVEDNRQSVSEYLEHHGALFQNLYDNYIPALAAAVFTGQNNDRLKGLAGSILKTDLSNMKQSVRADLIRVKNSETFDYDLGRIMDDIIRYAMVEELRKGLDGFVSQPKQVDPSGYQQPNIYAQPKPHTHIPPEVMDQRMANNVESGVKAGRDYGGCASVELTNSKEHENGDNPQAAYGGKGSKDNPEGKGSPSAKLNCIKCRIEVNRKEVTKDPKSWRCPHCKYEVDICTGKQKYPSEPPGRSKKVEQDLAPVISIMDKIKQAEQADQERQRQKAQEQRVGKLALAA